MANRITLKDKLDSTYKPNSFYKISAPTGSGKTEWVIQYIKSFLDLYPTGRICLLTYRIIIGMKMFNDLEDLGFQYYIDGCNHRKIIISCESLFKWTYTANKDSPLLLILDEINSLVNHLSSSTMINSFTSFTGTFDHLVSTAECIVCLDAYYPDHTKEFIACIADSRFDYISYEFPRGLNPVNKVDSIITFNENKFIQIMVDELKQERMIYIWSGSKSFLDKLAGTLIERAKIRMDNILIITGESPPVIKRKAGGDPNDLWSGIPVVGCTPCLIAGVSYTLHPRSVFVAINFKILPSIEDCMQAAGRVRKQNLLVFYPQKSEIDIKFPENSTGVKEYLAQRRVKKLTHLAEVLGLTSIMSNEEGILRYFIVESRDNKYTRAILGSVTERFKFRNNPDDSLINTLSRDERYNPPSLFESRSPSKALYCNDKFSDQVLTFASDIRLSASLDNLSNSCSSIFSNSLESESYEPSTSDDMVWFRILKLMHLYRLIGTDYYNYDGSFEGFQTHNKFDVQTLTKMVSRIEKIVHYRNLNRLRLLLGTELKDNLEYELNQVLSFKENILDIRVSISEIKQVFDILGVSFETGITPSSLEWDVSKLKQIALVITGGNSNVESITQCPVYNKAKDFIRYHTNEDHVYMADFVRSVFQAIGLKCCVGKAHALRGIRYYSKRDFYNHSQCLDNKFIMYLAKRRKYKGEIVTSFFLGPLNYGWMNGTEFFHGYATWGNPLENSVECYYLPRQYDLTVNSSLDLYFDFSFHRVFFNHDKPMTEPYSESINLSKWKMDHFNVLLNCEKFLTKKLNLFRLEVNCFISSIDDYKHEIIRNDNEILEFKEKEGKMRSFRLDKKNRNKYKLGLNPWEFIAEGILREKNIIE